MGGEALVLGFRRLGASGQGYPELGRKVGEN